MEISREANSSVERMTSLLATTHGVLYVITGFWPVLHMPSFEWVTGPKRDDWLVKTVGALLGVIGTVFLLQARQKQFPPEAPVLAAGTATTLALVDIVYYKKGILRWVYLVDAAMEILLAAGWLTSFGLLHRGRSRT